MQDQFKNFLSVLKAFEEYHVDYILIGGVAVIFHGLDRLTRDIDFFIKLSPTNIENLRKALSSIFDDTSIEEITVEEFEKYPVIRYGTPNGFYIDLMARLGEAVMFEDVKYEIIEQQRIRIRIATPEILYALKKDTLRAKDQLDIMFLQEIIKARRNRKKGN